MKTLPQGSGWAAWATVLLLGVGIFIAVHSIIPAEVRIESEPTRFLLGNALDQLQKIAKKPHPIGSKEHDRVRDYIVSRIKELGYEVEIQKAIVPLTYGNFLKKGQEIPKRWGDITGKVKVAYVENILVRIAGKNHDKAILVSGHYDSVTGAAGAGDDGAAVASMLEILRIFKIEKEFENDVIFLFDDGEEMGLLGAKAFVDYHPWAKDVEIALNFEARGATGNSLMFETSPKNGWLIQEFADFGESPRTSSAIYEVYKAMPNNTNFTIFQNAGMKGLSFGFVGKHTHYHTELDNVENLDRRSLQHQGNSILKITKHFAKTDFSKVKLEQEDHVFFNIPNDGVIHYQVRWVPYISSAVIGFFVLLLLIGSIGRMLNIAMIFVYWIGISLVTALTMGISHYLWKAIMLTHPTYKWMANGDVYNSDLYVITFSVLVVAIFSFFYKLIHKKANHLNLMGGAMLWWLILMAFTSYQIPLIKLPFGELEIPAMHIAGASYLFTIPMIFALLIWAYFILRGRKSRRYTFLDAAIVGALAFPIIYVMLPMIYLVQLALTIQKIEIVMLFAVLTIALLTPLVKMLVDGFKWAFPSLLLLTTCILLAYGSFTSPFSPTRKKANSILYALDFDKNEALWASGDVEPDEFTEQFIGTNPETDSLKQFLLVKPRSAILVKKADTLANIPAPKVAFLSDSLAEGKHFTKIKITSEREAERMYLHFADSNQISQIFLSDSLIYTQKTDSSTLNYLDIYGFSKEGAIFTFVNTNEKIDLRIVEIKYGMDEVWSEQFTQRKPYMMPSPIKRAIMNNAVLTSKSFSFDLMKKEEEE